MTPEQFLKFLHDAKNLGLISSDRDAANILGVHHNSILNFKKRGCNKRTAMACKQLISNSRRHGK